MSKVTFKAEQKYFSVTHEHLFHCGAIMLPRVAGGMDTDFEKCKELGIPAPEKFYSGYCFSEGEDHNLLTLETEEEIEAMREYAKVTGNRIVELDEDGAEPADPEGTPFIADTPHKVLTPAMYKGTTPAEGKTFNFNMGTEKNQYITADTEEIAIIRGYVLSHANCGIKDPTYKAPVLE